MHDGLDRRQDNEIKVPAETGTEGTTLGWLVGVVRELFNSVCAKKLPGATTIEGASQDVMLGAYLRKGDFKRGFQLMNEQQISPKPDDVLHGLGELGERGTDPSIIISDNIAFAIQLLRTIGVSMSEDVFRKIKSRLISIGKIEMIEQLCGELGRPPPLECYAECGDTILKQVCGKYRDGGIYWSEKVDAKVQEKNREIENTYERAIGCFAKAKNAQALQRCMDQALRGGWKSAAKAAARAISELSEKENGS